MKRSVVKHGPSTFIISLPNRWVKKYNITKGSELEVNDEGNKIIISTDDEVKTVEINIDVTNLDRTGIMFAIRGLYRMGYDVINITFNNPTTKYYRQKAPVSVSSAIHKEVNRLIGYEIIQEKEKQCTIKDLQIISAKEFDQILKRIFFLMIDASKDLIEGIKTNNADILETIENKHDTITKFVSYCSRILSKHGYEEQKKTANYYYILGLLDRITDVIKYAARDLIEYKKKLNPKIIELSEEILKDVSRFYSLFYGYDNKKADEIHMNRYKVESEIKNLPDSIKTFEIMVITNLFNMLWIILDLIEARTALEY